MYKIVLYKLDQLAHRQDPFNYDIKVLADSKERTAILCHTVSSVLQLQGVMNIGKS